uniref:Uncharacterized protein n=1 Tax=Setaria digitata TaxID=48799 RepID=A0A915PX17_9BILA
MNIGKILDMRPLENPTALLDRIQEFLPKIAKANANLDDTATCDIKIVSDDSESVASSSFCSSTDSDDELQTLTDKPQIVMNVTTVVEDPPNRMIVTDSDSDDDNTKQQALPVGFRTKKLVRRKERKRLVEEVEEYKPTKGEKKKKESFTESKTDR